jgi:hypothetical protein
MVVFLVPAGHSRFELYSEPPDDQSPAPSEQAGVVRRWAHAASVKWHELVKTARQGAPAGRFGRWRDAAVCKLAESIAEQRTLWSLTDASCASLRYPSMLEDTAARAQLARQHATARSHHLRWLIIDTVIFVATAALAIVPGPNLLAYYFAFRLIGHFQSWRGARRAIEGIAWTFDPDASLAELASLVDVPREARASRVAAIAAGLNLSRLSAFFDRVAVPPAGVR